jgi:hypothetical protein
MTGTVCVERPHTAVNLQIPGDHLPVCESGVAAIEEREQLARGIVEHSYQRQLVCPATFQPVILRTVHRDEFPTCSAPRTAFPVS